MSVEAITWALNSDVKHSSAKFVLVVLANCASAETMEAYPSIYHLSEATSQDRKTVIANLKRLIDSGHILNTGKRKGTTGQVIIYRLNSTKIGTVKEVKRPEAEKRNIDLCADVNYGKGRHYLYRLQSDSGQFYIGVRTCVGNPSLDEYMGSGRWVKSCKFANISLTKTIISEHKTRPEADAQELVLIDQYLTDPLCMNSPKTGTVSLNQTVPNFPDKSTVFPSKEYRFSPETVPKTGHGTVRTVSEPSVNQKHTSDAELFPDVSVQVISDFKVLRKNLKAPITKTAIAGIQREADAAGISLESALTHCVERSWRGFKADWLKVQPAREGPAYQSIHDKRAETIAILTGRKSNERSADRDITAESSRVA